jgi:hypothetical protein
LDFFLPFTLAVVVAVEEFFAAAAALRLLCFERAIFFWVEGESVTWCDLDFGFLGAAIVAAAARLVSSQIIDTTPTPHTINRLFIDTPGSTPFPVSGRYALWAMTNNCHFHQSLASKPSCIPLFTNGYSAAEIGCTVNYLSHNATHVAVAIVVLARI